MKKSFPIILLSFVLFISFSSKMMSQKVEYEVLTVEDIPEKVQKEFSKSTIKNGFSIHTFDNYTYVLYRADHKENEYISTDLTAHKINDQYIVTSEIKWAHNDHLVSYEKVIKLAKVSQDNIKLMVSDKR